METLYGFARTICACDVCRKNCRHLSGMVAPEDLRRWRTHFGAQFAPWAIAHLAASPGAIVQQHGHTFRIPTIVPAREVSGRCHFLTQREDCLIHAIAPFGCGWFDHRQSAIEGNLRSARALADILYDLVTDGPYHRLWDRLACADKVVEAPEVARLRLALGAKEEKD